MKVIMMMITVMMRKIIKTIIEIICAHRATVILNGAELLKGHSSSDLIPSLITFLQPKSY